MASEDSSSFIDRLYRSSGYRTITALGLIIALVTAPLAIPPVQNALFPKTAGLTIEVERQIPAFDAKRHVPDLVVLYRGQDLRKSNIDLIISRVAFRNSGNISIGESSVSRSDPVGLKISGGKLIGVSNVVASSEHLRRKAHPVTSESQIQFPTNIILDPNDYIQFDMIISSPKNSRIEFQSSGKVEGINRINIVTNANGNNNESLLVDVFQGNAYVQIARLAAYFMFGALIFAGFITVAFQFSALRDRYFHKKRAKLASKARVLCQDADDTLWALVANAYAKFGMAGLSLLSRQLARPKLSIQNATGASPPPERGDISTPLYLKKAFERDFYIWQLGDYFESVADAIGIDISDNAVRSSILDLIQTFERRIEEVGAVSGIEPKSLERSNGSSFHYDVVVDPAFDLPDLKASRLRERSRDESSKNGK